MDNEIWVDILGYEGLYQISNTGKVKSLNYKSKKNYHRELVLDINRYGYAQVHLSKNGHKKVYTVHRLVAKTFIPNPDNFPVINHIDGNKLNNIVSNLEWCTSSYNTKHAIKNNLIKTKDESAKAVKVVCLNTGEIFGSIKSVWGFNLSVHVATKQNVVCKQSSPYV